MRLREGAPETEPEDRNFHPCFAQRAPACARRDGACGAQSWWKRNAGSRRGSAEKTAPDESAPRDGHAIPSAEARRVAI